MTMSVADAAELIAATDALRHVIAATGTDPDRPGMEDTPNRWVAALLEMTAGTHVDPASYLATRFTNDADYHGPITVGPVAFTSVCEHHLLPFTGTAIITYTPAARTIVGLSKLPRMFLAFAHRLQVQERLTQQALDCLVAELRPLAAAVEVTATHTCMTLRGVQATGAMTTRAVYEQQ